MNEPGKSDKPIVPMKSASGGSRLNFWEFIHQLQRTEGRGLAKENEDPSGNSTAEVFQVDPAKQTDRTQSRLGEGTSDPEGLHSALDRVRQVISDTADGRDHPRQEPGAVIPPAGICAGGGGQPPSLPRQLVLPRRAVS